eukprot:5532644-Prymnesium_polylepis.1
MGVGLDRLANEAVRYAARLPAWPASTRQPCGARRRCCSWTWGTDSRPANRADWHDAHGGIAQAMGCRGGGGHAHGLSVCVL